MANCKDNCIHYKVCMYGDLTEYKTEQILKDDCDDYMSKDVVPKSEVEYMTKEEIVQIIGEADKYCKNTSCTKCKFNEIKTPYCWWHNIAEHIYTAQNTNNFDSRQTIEENKKKYTESEGTK